MPTTRTYHRKCVHCGETFTHVITGRGAPRTTCSAQCREEARKRVLKSKLSTTRCRVKGCRKPLRSTGSPWCEMHYGRVRFHGEPGEAEPRTHRDGRDHHNWLGDDAGYRAIHSRLAATRGRAAEFGCVDCLHRAHHWSYDHTDPDEKRGYDAAGNYLVFSTDLSRYEPRCASCHREFDEAEKANGMVKL